eukprot:5354428-Amphidinium_carterae.1
MTNASFKHHFCPLSYGHFDAARATCTRPPSLIIDFVGVQCGEGHQALCRCGSSSCLNVMT